MNDYEKYAPVKASQAQPCGCPGVGGHFHGCPELAEPAGETTLAYCNGSCLKVTIHKADVFTQTIDGESNEVAVARECAVCGY